MDTTIWGICWGYLGVMEKRMETTFRVHIENSIKCCVVKAVGSPQPSTHQTLNSVP